MRISGGDASGPLPLPPPDMENEEEPDEEQRAAEREGGLPNQARPRNAHVMSGLFCFLWCFLWSTCLREIRSARPFARPAHPLP